MSRISLLVARYSISFIGVSFQSLFCSSNLRDLLYVQFDDSENDFPLERRLKRFDSTSSARDYVVGSCTTRNKIANDRAAKSSDSGHPLPLDQDVRIITLVNRLRY